MYHFMFGIARRLAGAPVAGCPGRLLSVFFAAVLLHLASSSVSFALSGAPSMRKHVIQRLSDDAYPPSRSTRRT